MAKNKQGQNKKVWKKKAKPQHAETTNSQNVQTSKPQCVDVELFAQKRLKQANSRGMRFYELHRTHEIPEMDLCEERIAQLADRTTRKNILKMKALSHALGSRFCEDLFGIICDFAAYFVYSSFSLARFVANGRVQVSGDKKPCWISLKSSDAGYLTWKMEPDAWYIRLQRAFCAGDLWSGMLNFGYSHCVFRTFPFAEDALRSALLSAAGLDIPQN